MPPMKMSLTTCAEMLETYYRSILRNISEERTRQPEAASVEVPVWQFYIEGLPVTCSGRSKSVTK